MNTLPKPLVRIQLARIPLMTIRTVANTLAKPVRIRLARIPLMTTRTVVISTVRPRMNWELAVLSSRHLLLSTRADS
jgi:hypothetical protein